MPDTGTAASGKYYVRSTNGGARRKRLDALIKDLEDGADKKERRMRVLFWNR